MCMHGALTPPWLSPIVSWIADSAGEIDVIRFVDRIGAEGATAPETLRQKDRAASIARLWKVPGRQRLGRRRCNPGFLPSHGWEQGKALRFP
jgi:hypothetical protein